MTPTLFVDLLLEAPMPPTWQLSVYAAEPGLHGAFAQVDMINPEGDNEGSVSLHALAAAGYDIPDIDKLPSGKYTPDLRPLPKIDRRHYSKDGSLHQFDGQDRRGSAAPGSAVAR
jgi:hypothetical protein